MTTWIDGGDYGRLRRQVMNENGSRAICTVWTRQSGYGYGDEPWPEGKVNFRLILQAPKMLEALEAIAEGAIVSSDQTPEKIAESVLRVLRLARESAAEYMTYAGKQQQRAERAEAALEEIAALKAPGWSSLGDVLKVYHRHKEIARAAIAAAKGEDDDDIG